MKPTTCTSSLLPFPKTKPLLQKFSFPNAKKNQLRFGSTTATLTKSEELMKLEDKYCAHNYSPLPIVFSKAKGVTVWDPEGKEYLDFLSAYSAVNQGHCHEKILQTFIDQASKLTLSSRAFYNDQLPIFAEFCSRYFGYEKILPMNTGAEGVETAIKLAKKWGYKVKGVPKGKAIIISVDECFHGRTHAAISLSNDPSARDGFEPLLPNVLKTSFNDASTLEAILNEHGENVVGFIVEPIQGEAGVRVPVPGYLQKCKELCEKHKVLFIADEIQTGLGRTGKLLAINHENIRPDMLILGKAISGGMVPLSLVLTDSEVMNCIRPGEHGSTYGGNPLASAVGITALEVLKSENMIENAEKMGNIFLSEMRDLAKKHSFILDVRGRGLLDAIEIDHSPSSPSAKKICLKMKDYGVLAKPTHDYTIRFAPPLVITEPQMQRAIDVIKKSFSHF